MSATWCEYSFLLWDGQKAFRYEINSSLNARIIIKMTWREMWRMNCPAISTTCLCLQTHSSYLRKIPLFHFICHIWLISYNVRRSLVFTSLKFFLLPDFFFSEPSNSFRTALNFILSTISFYEPWLPLIRLSSKCTICVLLVAVCAPGRRWTEESAALIILLKCVLEDVRKKITISAVE